MSHKKDKHHEKDSKMKRFKTKYETPKKDKDNNEPKSAMMTGIYKEGRGDFGFIDIIDEAGNKKGYYVYHTHRGEALDGDEVMFYTREFKGKQEAIVEEVTKRSDKVLTGTFQSTQQYSAKDNKGYGFVIMDNPYVKTDVFIAGKDLAGLEDGDKVALKITKWGGKNPEGTIIEKIGKTGDKYVDVMAMAYEGGARPTFPPKLIETLKNMPKKVEEKDLGGKRRDLRDLFVYTIDPDDAKDFDDAISIEKLKKGNFKLWVHIADVTHYVTEGSELDNEAKLRGTSIYFVDRVVPMLPEILSNELCSLNPFEDKLTLTCEMEIDPKGEVIKSETYESVINSNFRLSYKNAEDIMKMGFKDWSIDNLLLKNDKYTQDDALPLFEKLKLSYELKEILYNFKKENGYVEFDLVETKIIVNESGFPVEIKEYPKYEANRVIEFFMILANESVAKKYSELPFLYRVHPDPEPEDIDRLKYALKYIGVDYKDKLTDIIEKIKGKEEESFISKLILKTMTRAMYSPINDGHYGLGLEFYSHFTSPIRRYPDLQIHRIIKEHNNGKLSKARIEHYTNILPNVASLCSEQERMAEDIEHKVDDYLKAKFMIDKIGEEYDGVISGVIERGIFVQLENTVEGFVDLSSGGHNKDNKKGGKKGGKHDKLKLDFNSMLLEVKNPITGEKYRLADKVRIRVKEVDEVFSRIDFELVK
ncbi:ribonuclease R [Candidatus Gracilibacteria bacterium]|nr:ribonuclease R [Candidatus Gracilibacteria bacterium]